MANTDRPTSPGLGKLALDRPAVRGDVRRLWRRSRNGDGYVGGAKRDCRRVVVTYRYPLYGAVALNKLHDELLRHRSVDTLESVRCPAVRGVCGVYEAGLRYLYIVYGESC